MSLNVNNQQETICDVTASYTSAGTVNGKQYVRYSLNYLTGKSYFNHKDLVQRDVILGQEIFKPMKILLKFTKYTQFIHQNLQINDQTMFGKNAYYHPLLEQGKKSEKLDSTTRRTKKYPLA